MIDIRPFASLGGTHCGWLKARHHFSFADYEEEERMGWGALLVWNDEEIAPGAGFPAHVHTDIDIITYVRSGALTQGDSLGHDGRVEAGHVQVMSAGSGIRHSEYNLEPVPAHLFQIWLRPQRGGGRPDCQARHFPCLDHAGAFVLLASGEAGEEPVPRLRSDARVLGLNLRAGQWARYAALPERHLYLVPSHGQITVNGRQLAARDGAAIRFEPDLRFEALEDSAVLLVDAP
ncbi:pirin family protein [Acidisoma sp. 7E03]